MAAARQLRPKTVKRTKVLSADMGGDTPVARKRAVEKPPPKKKPATKKKVIAVTAVEPSSECPSATSREDIATPCHEPGDPRPQRRSAVDRLDDPPPASGPLLIARVANAIERELTQIEIIVGNNRVPPRERTEAERRARTLASLARTLAVVTQLRAKNLQSLDDDADNDAMPRDLDDLRETLARRLEQLLAGQPQPADGEPEPG